MHLELSVLLCSKSSLILLCFAQQLFIPIPKFQISLVRPTSKWVLPLPISTLGLATVFMSATPMSEFPLPSVTTSLLLGHSASPACQLSCHPSFTICCPFLRKVPRRKLRYWSIAHKEVRKRMGYTKQVPQL